MSCRHNAVAPLPHLIATAPSHLRKWRRFPRTLPQPANDNARPGSTAEVGLWAAALGATATMVAVLMVGMML
ncbi:hypothetical protein VQ02_02620 [Methylobacterium variabile]|jgi:hypothetical protein|uniref:Uncharacterized protein n=1 Tax=Methylobacterium variabile TaxID=298794 RepID=A0A0J6T9N6_9HYPH|nr:hypothetical protein [Methylobacterium variabile]KMO42584.1 hypothetical protein VQ02_02620 [Methylobacterium variabile]